MCRKNPSSDDAISVFRAVRVLGKIGFTGLGECPRAARLAQSMARWKMDGFSMPVTSGYTPTAIYCKNVSDTERNWRGNCGTVKMAIRKPVGGVQLGGLNCRLIV